jgi:hypothetical protein
MATINVKSEDVEGVLSLTKQVAVNMLLEKNGKLCTLCIVKIDPSNNWITVGNRVYAMDTYWDSMPSLQLVSTSDPDSPMLCLTLLDGLPRHPPLRIMLELPDYHEDFHFEHQINRLPSPAVNFARPLFQHAGTPYPDGMLPLPASYGTAPQCSTHPWVHTQITIDKEIKRVKLFGLMDPYTTQGCNRPGTYLFCCPWHYYRFKEHRNKQLVISWPPACNNQDENASWGPAVMPLPLQEDAKDTYTDPRWAKLALRTVKKLHFGVTCWHCQQQGHMHSECPDQNRLCRHPVQELRWGHRSSHCQTCLPGATIGTHTMAPTWGFHTCHHCSQMEVFDKLIAQCENHACGQGMLSAQAMPGTYCQLVHQHLQEGYTLAQHMLRKKKAAMEQSWAAVPTDLQKYTCIFVKHEKELFL